MDIKKRIEKKLIFLYGKKDGRKAAEGLISMLEDFEKNKSADLKRRDRKRKGKGRLNEKDSILITYGDFIRKKGEKPLKTLERFAAKQLKGSINTIHILPFFSYHSDRGFSILDYNIVDPKLGNWKNIEQLRKRKRLMFDLVLNHMSSKSEWFRRYADGDKEFEDFFVGLEKRPAEKHIRKIFRPRQVPLFVPFKTSKGRKLMWRSFLNDQLDINYKNYRALLKMTEVLLRYINEGADMIRLDAIGYVWKKIGTSCVNLRETHVFMKLLRDITDAVAKHVVLIAEVNFPHKINISYLGDGNDESHMVYNFSLPPLVIQALHTGNAKHLTRWARTLKTSNTTAFFNFLDSHDGIGVGPLEGLIGEKEKEELVRKAVERGGKTGYKVQGGVKKPYEINITWWSMLDDGKDEEMSIKRYLLSRAIALSVRGVPGIYLHGLLGTENDIKGYKKTKHRRDINRKNLSEKELIGSLKRGRTAKIFKSYCSYIEIRKRHKAFHPEGEQKIVDMGKELFALERASIDKKERILCIHNVSDKPVNARVDGKDLISGKNYSGKSIIKPYQSMWIKK